MAASPATTRDNVLELYEMLSYMRPHYSKTEEAFIQEFIVPLGVKTDTFGNLYKRIGTAPVAWSSHTDTVHFKGGRQAIQLRDKRILELDQSAVSGCLGADDTAGVWLMTEMIKSEVSGLYMFHRGEEVGCKGSEWLLKNNPKALDGIKAVVALDRKDNDSVITFQRGQRCCSNDFGKSMAEELNSVMWGEFHMDYKLDDTGMYTDSATYTDIVGECTNLSVGYKGQHGKSETLDLHHIAYLREALLRVDLSKLRYSRVAGTKESKYQNWQQGGYGYRRPYDGEAYGEFDVDADFNGSGARKTYVERFQHGYWCSKKHQWVSLSHSEWLKWRTAVYLKSKSPAAVTSKAIQPTNFMTALQDNRPKVPKPVKDDMPAIVALVKANPDAITRMLLDWGFDDKMVQELVFEYSIDKPAEVTAAVPDKEGAAIQ